MLRNYIIFAVLLMSYVNAGAASYPVLTSPPPPQESILPPKGYTTCVTIPAGFYNNTIWVSEHRVCEYRNLPDRVVWISEQWRCVKYRPKQGICEGWEWMPSRWSNERVFY
jgi:hypothetical protein